MDDGESVHRLSFNSAALRLLDLPEQDDPSAHHRLEFNQSSESRALRPSTVSIVLYNVNIIVLLVTTDY